MKHINKFLNLPLINQAIIDLESEKELNRKKQNALRIRIWRLKKIVRDQDQIDFITEQNAITQKTIENSPNHIRGC